MKKFLIPLSVLILATVFFIHAWTQDDEPATEAAEGLDLYVVAETFQEAENLEDFEEKLNDPDAEIVNLDLDEDGEVDYVSVEEQIENDTHVIILRDEVEENEIQDVATIEIEKKGEEDYTCQVVGDEELYGEDYIIDATPEESSTTTTTTTAVYVHTYPTVRVIFRPGYHRWVSPWRFPKRPGHWRRRPVLTRSVYRSRMSPRRKSAHWHRTPTRRSPRAKTMHKNHRRTTPKATHKTKKNTNYKQQQNKQQTQQKNQQQNQNQQKQQSQQQNKQKSQQQQKKKQTSKKKKGPPGAY